MNHIDQHIKKVKALDYLIFGTLTITILTVIILL